MNQEEKDNAKTATLQLAEAKLGNIAQRYRHNSRLEACGSEVALWLHRTPIVTVGWDGIIHLNTGGWETVTTKCRMNEALEALGATFRISQENFIWRVCGIGDNSIPARDYLDYQCYNPDGTAVPW